MKKYGIFLLALLLVLPLSGCQSEAKEHNPFFDLYDLTVMETEDGQVTPAKFNVKTGALTALCEDPLCRHTTPDCPFYGYWAYKQPLYYEKNRLYFLALSRQDQDVGGQNRELRSYDMESGTVKVVADDKTLVETYYPEELKQVTGRGESIRDGYYWRSVQDDAGSTVFQLRVKLSDGSVEVLDPAYDSPFAVLKNEELYYSPDTIQTGVSDGLFIKNRKTGKTEQILTDHKIVMVLTVFEEEEELLYVTAEKDENGRYVWEHMGLWFYSMKTGEDRLVHPDFPDRSYAVIGKDLYYLRWLDDGPIVGYNQNRKKDVRNWSGGILFRMNIGTGEESRVFELPAYTLMEVHAVGEYLVAEYLNTDYENYTEEETDRGVWYDYPEEKGRIVCHIPDGEVKIYPETDPASEEAEGS